MADPFNPDVSGSGVQVSDVSRPLVFQPRVDTGLATAIKTGADLLNAGKKAKAQAGADLFVADMERSILEQQQVRDNASIFQRSAEADAVLAAQLATDEDGVTTSDAKFINETNINVARLRKMQETGILNPTVFKIKMRSIKDDALASHPGLRKEINGVFSTLGINKDISSSSVPEQKGLPSTTIASMDTLYGQGKWGAVQLGQQAIRNERARQIDTNLSLGRVDSAMLSNSIPAVVSLGTGNLYTATWNKFQKQGFLSTDDISLFNVELDSIETSFQEELSKQITASIRKGNLITQDQQDKLRGQISDEVSNMRELVTGKDLITRGQQAQDLANLQLTLGLDMRTKIIKDISQFGGGSGLGFTIQMMSASDSVKANIESFLPESQRQLYPVYEEYIQDLTLLIYQGFDVADPGLLKVQNFLRASMVRDGAATPDVKDALVGGINPKLKGNLDLADAAEFLNQSDVSTQLGNDTEVKNLKPTLLNMKAMSDALAADPSNVISKLDDGTYIVARLAAEPVSLTGGGLTGTTTAGVRLVEDPNSTRALNNMVRVFGNANYTSITGGSQPIIDSIDKNAKTADDKRVLVGQSVTNAIGIIATDGGKAVRHEVRQAIFNGDVASMALLATELRSSLQETTDEGTREVLTDLLGRLEERL
jgi:hypothetical protein